MIDQLSLYTKMETEFNAEIPASKALMPLYVTLFFLTGVIGLNLMMFGWPYAVTGVAVFLAIVFLLKKYSGWKFFNKKFYIRADKDGVSWRKNIFSSAVFLPWNAIIGIDFLLYEINFTVKREGDQVQIVCLEANYLDKAEHSHLKDVLSSFFKQGYAT